MAAAQTNRAGVAYQPCRSPHHPRRRCSPTRATRSADSAEMSREHQLVDQTVDGLRRGRELAAARDRSDLASTLDQAQQRIDQRTISVAVVGEFKRGKSTLVNALLHTAVCPVDADEVTVVPTIIRYAETAGATAYFEASGEDGEPLTEPIAVESIAEYVSETGNPGNVRGLRSVEVRLPRRMLRTGLCLIDTPGVGGLDSRLRHHHSRRAGLADGVLFVCDASQELTHARAGLPPAGAAALPAGRLRRHQDRPVSAVAADRRARPGTPAPAAGIDIPVIAGVVVPAARRPPRSGAGGRVRLPEPGGLSGAQRRSLRQRGGRGRRRRARSTSWPASSASRSTRRRRC